MEVCKISLTARRLSVSLCVCVLLSFAQVVSLGENSQKCKNDVYHRTTPSNGTISKFVVRDLDLLFQDKIFEVLAHRLPLAIQLPRIKKKHGGQGVNISPMARAIVSIVNRHYESRTL